MQRKMISCYESADMIEYKQMEAVSCHSMINIHIPIVESHGLATTIMLSNAGWYRMRYKGKGLDVMSAERVE